MLLNRLYPLLRSSVGRRRAAPKDEHSCHIDLINSTPMADGRAAIVYSSGDNLRVCGWAVDATNRQAARRVELLLDGKPYPVQYGIERQDVALAFRQQAYRSSGFSAEISGISSGDHILSVRIHPYNGKVFQPRRPLCFSLQRIDPHGGRKISRDVVAACYVAGEGIEIGALHNPLQVPGHVRVRYVDRMSVEELRKHYPELNSLPLVPVDIIDDGEQLKSLPAGSQDFVIANHFIEHCENPILTIQNVLRVLKAGGNLYLAVPDKRETFDRDRPVTTFEHLLRDFSEGPEQSREAHFREWVTLKDKVTEPDQVEANVKTLMAKSYSIHFHVWDGMSFLDFLQRFRPHCQEVEFDVDLFVQQKEEIIVILKKR